MKRVREDGQKREDKKAGREGGGRRDGRREWEKEGGRSRETELLKQQPVLIMTTIITIDDDDDGHGMMLLQLGLQLELGRSPAALARGRWRHRRPLGAAGAIGDGHVDVVLANLHAHDAAAHRVVARGGHMERARVPGEAAGP